MNGSTIERKVLWGFGLALLFVCGLAVLTYFAERNVRDATLAASRTQHLLLQIANLRYRFSASEAHQRAFLISREPRTLQDRDQALAAVKGAIAELKSLTADEFAQQGRLAQLEQALAERIVLLNDNVELARREGLVAIAAFFAKGGTQSQREREDRILEDIEQAEIQRLASREADIRQASNLANGATLVLVLAMTLLLATLFLRIRGDMRERLAADADRAEAARLDRSQSRALALFNASLDRGDTLGRLLALLAEDHPYPAGAFCGYDEWQGLFRCEATRGIPAGVLKEFRRGEGLVGQAAAGEGLAVLEAPSAGFVFETGIAAVRPAALLMCPVRYQERTLGVLTLAASRVPSEAERSFVEKLASQLAIALHNARLYGDLRLLSDQLRQRGEEIATKNAELERANEMKSQFLANMSHELRTPLNAIIGFSEVIRDGMAGPLSEQQARFMRDIHGSATHLLDLINDILDLSKVEAGAMELEVAPVDLAPLLENSAAMLREKAAVQRIRLALQASPALVPFLADARRIKQMVFNLLSNAIKFTPEGGSVTVTANLVPREAVPLEVGAAAEQWVEIGVADTGIGIGEDEIGRLFQPFVQLDSSLGRRHAGTGLGLSLVRQFALLHGGNVAVSSRPGEGSRFRFWLPYHPADGAAQPTSVQAATAVGPSEEGQPLAMVVEDDPIAAQLVRVHLAAEGFRVLHAKSAEEALELLKTRRPRLITLDILLPGMDGLQMLERLREDPAINHIPVVIISVADQARKGFSLGAASVLQKPIAREELLHVLEGLGLRQTPDRRAKVLVVDDEPHAVETIARSLEEHGCEVVRTYSGREAIDVSRKSAFDLIVLDLLMPEMSGFEVADALKSDPRTAVVPVLALTQKIVGSEDHAALKGRVLRIIEKAEFRPEDLIREVRRAVAASMANKKEESNG
jgi:signal transduction histidine kinase/DNA-binding response OmpR family regulator/CHASE3 domain sensor protein